MRSSVAERRVSGPVTRSRRSERLLDEDPAAFEDPIGLDDDAPWFAALPASLLAPADEPAFDELDGAVDSAERLRDADREQVARELSALADPARRPAPAHPDRSRPAGPADDAPVSASEWAPVYDPVTGRRTVTIRGRGAERSHAVAPGASRRDRPAPPRHQRSGFVADRAAMWAVLLGVLLVLIAVASGHS